MPRTKNDCKSHLVHLLSYLDNREYPKDTVFSQDRLAELTPADILKWMNVKTFGVENPPADANPTLARANSIQHWKKAVSSFMPDHGTWSTANQTGNPTKSKEINDLIAYVKKKQVRKQGVPSRARRALTKGEYTQQQTMLREGEEFGNISRLGVPAFANFQVHMIAQIDDVSQWKRDAFKPHEDFPEYAAKSRLAWSKNVSEERDAPWQIVLGCRDPLFCVFIGLGIWLEYYLSVSDGTSPCVFDFSNDHRVPQGGDRSHDFVMQRSGKIHGHALFEAEGEGPLGSHSIRKFFMTWARRSGASKDERDYRGRWKGKCRASDACDEPELPHVDAKVAAMLCPGGPCSCRIKSDSPVMDDWILEHVVPNIAASSCGTMLAKLLGKALLWTTFSENSAWVLGSIVDA